MNSALLLFQPQLKTSTHHSGIQESPSRPKMYQQERVRRSSDPRLGNGYVCLLHYRVAQMPGVRSGLQLARR